MGIHGGFFYWGFRELRWGRVGKKKGGGMGVERWRFEEEEDWDKIEMLRVNNERNGVRWERRGIV